MHKFLFSKIVYANRLIRREICSVVLLLRVSWWVSAASSSSPYRLNSSKHTAKADLKKFPIRIHAAAALPHAQGLGVVLQNYFEPKTCGAVSSCVAGAGRWCSGRSHLILQLWMCASRFLLTRGPLWVLYGAPCTSCRICRNRVCGAGHQYSFWPEQAGVGAWGPRDKTS